MGHQSRVRRFGDTAQAVPGGVGGLQGGAVPGTEPGRPHNAPPRRCAPLIGCVAPSWYPPSNGSPRPGPRTNERPPLRRRSAPRTRVCVAAPRWHWSTG
jgi:hypothetical protein